MDKTFATIKIKLDKISPKIDGDLVVINIKTACWGCWHFNPSVEDTRFAYRCYTPGDCPAIILTERTRITLIKERCDD